MATKMVAEEAISGTWGELWLDGEKFAEVNAFSAKVNLMKEKIPVNGKRNGTGTKITGYEGVGSFTYTKVDSRLLKKQVTALKAGKPLSCTLVGKLDDPAAKGHERVAIYGVMFDDITLAGWSNNQTVSVEKPFTFEDFDLLDAIA